MITILKGEKNSLERLDELIPDVWVNVVAPSEDDMTRLQQELGIPRDFLTSTLDVDEKARTDSEGDVRLILLRIPYSHSQPSDIPFTTVPLGIILVRDIIVTVCQVESDIIQDFITGRAPGFSTAKRNRLLLRILFRTATEYLRHLRQIDRKVDELEDKLRLSTRNREVLELVTYQKSLVYFTTALRSNELMTERLQKSGLFERYPEDRDFLEDVLTENQQAIEMVNISSSILSQMMDAFASIISNNLNVVMKFLTAVTIILMFPTLVASFYGMNVGLPLQHSPYAFLITLAVSFALSATVVLVFLKKDWF